MPTNMFTKGTINFYDSLQFPNPLILTTVFHSQNTSLGKMERVPQFSNEEIKRHFCVANAGCLSVHKQELNDLHEVSGFSNASHGAQGSAKEQSFDGKQRNPK